MPATASPRAATRTPWATPTINLPLIAGHAGRARDRILRPSRRLYRQRAGHDLVRQLPTAAALKAFPVANPPTQSPWPTTRLWSANNTNPVDYTGSACLGAASSSTTTGIFCCSRTTRTWRRTAISPTIRSLNDGSPPARLTRSPPSRRRTTRTGTKARPGRSTAGFRSVRSFGDLKAVYTGSYMVRHIAAAGGLFELPDQRRRLVLRVHRRGAGYSYFRYRQADHAATRRSATGTTQRTTFTRATRSA